MVESSTILWALIVTLMVSMFVSRAALHMMHKCLEKHGDIGPKFYRHWGHARRASHMVVASVFLLFIYSVLGEAGGATIPLNGVYAVNMTLGVLYWQALGRVEDAVRQAEDGGTHLASVLHKVRYAEDFICSALMFNTAVAGAVGLSLVDWSAVKDKLIRSE